MNVLENCEISRFAAKTMLISFNPSERLMPDGTLTIDIEIKILPSVLTAVHGSPQDGAGAQRDCVLCHRTAKKNTGTDFFGDMVDNFVDMKLGSILIVFEDGEQKCHAFPLAARNAFGGKNFLCTGDPYYGVYTVLLISFKP